MFLGREVGLVNLTSWVQEGQRMVWEKGWGRRGRHVWQAEWPQERTRGVVVEPL